MLHINKLKIMELFFEEPARNFQIRQISRMSKLAVTSVKKYLDELNHEQLIKKDHSTVFVSYVANTENRMFKIYKQNIVLMKLYSSNTIDFLEDEFHPKSIVLFGSARSGEYTKNSDIDIFIQADFKHADLTKYEKILKHKINLLFEHDFNKLSHELFNNIINGIKLSGTIKLK